MKLLDLPHKELERMGVNGHKAVMENFNYKVLAKRFLDTCMSK